MKILICPICGGIKLRYSFREGTRWCLNCHTEVIPIVTPQEVRDEE